MQEENGTIKNDTPEINVTTDAKRLIVIPSTAIGQGGISAKTVPEIKLTIDEIFDMVDRNIINRDQAFRMIFRNERPDFRYCL